jgi:HSP90 family molecular chaperone
MTTRRRFGREEVVEKQNITLSLPREILKKGKVLAARKGISLNELVRELLQANTENDGEYQASAERQIKRMKEGIQLGTKGKITWKRDQLHQR